MGSDNTVNEDETSEIARLREQLEASQRELEDCKTRLRLVENSTDGLWDWELATGYDYLSPLWKSNLGYRDEELPNTVDSWQNLLQPGEKEKAFAAVERHFKDGTPYNIILKYRRKDGSSAHMLARGEAVKDTDGNPTRMAGTHTDVTMLVEAEQSLRARQKSLCASNNTLEKNILIGSSALAEANKELRKQELILEAIVNSITSGIISSSPEGKFLVFNPAAETILGVGSTEQDSDSWSEIYGVFEPDGTTRVPEEDLPLVKALSGTQTRGRKLVISNPTTGKRIVCVDADPLPQEAGGGAVVVFSDVTETVRSREALEEFAFVAAHDLQEPLRKVGSFCGLLLDDYGEQLDENGRRYAQIAVDGAARMKTLIQDLFQYARLGPAMYEHGAAHCDGHTVVTEVLETLDEQILASGASIDVEVPKQLPLPPQYAQQLFQNLIGNAIKYRCPDRTPEIRVRYEQLQDSTIIEFSDNGIGIEPQYFDKIFQIFKRLHGKGEYSGTGIGLSICKRIAEICGGTIRVESVFGSGTTFYVSLPKAHDDAGSET